MIKNYIMNAYDLNDLTNRLSILNKLSHLAPGTEFYACDLGLSGGTVNTLDREGIISCVRGKERDAQCGKGRKVYFRQNHPGVCRRDLAS